MHVEWSQSGKCLHIGELKIESNPSLDLEAPIAGIELAAVNDIGTQLRCARTDVNRGDATLWIEPRDTPLYRSSLGHLIRDSDAFGVHIYSETASGERWCVDVPFSDRADFEQFKSSASQRASASGMGLLSATLYADGVALEFVVIERVLVRAAYAFAIELGLLAQGHAGLNLERVKESLLVGQAGIFLDLPESAWLEAKRAPYGIADEREKTKFVTDVAALANNPDGGLLIIGAATSKDALGNDRISSIPGTKPSSIDVPQYLSVLGSKLYPRIHDLEVKTLEVGSGAVLVAFIVPGRGSDIPYLVKDRNSIVIPFRGSAGNTFWTVEDLHARLSRLSH